MHNQQLVRDNAARVRANKSRLNRCPRVAPNWERAALDYAQWIAARDGLTIPRTYQKPRVEWSSVFNETTRKNERRIRAVSWGHTEERYNRRKDGKRGAWSHNEFVAELTVILPHWDWVPQVFEEAPAPVAVRTERASYGGTIQLSQPVMVF